MLKVGNIYKLKLSHKIEEHGLLVFDLGTNTTAKLHISNLSNNQILSKKMFDLFEIDHEVTVLVTNFNEEKKYFELSTKAFRNSLDDVLSYTRCKRLIEEQFQKRSNQDTMFLLENRRILDRLRGDLASTGLTFLYELLQNAIDHPNNNFNKELSIHFEIFDNFLLLKHNGALFTENNFKSICGILFGEQQNETDINRIGYKGIGFKSVFRHSNNVYIRSGNFSFCFKKGTDADKIPWEVMPIFQSEINKIDEIPQFDFFNSPVAFAFEFPSEKHKNDVIKYLSELAQNPYLLIFLKNLRELKVTTPENEHIFERVLYSDESGRERIRLKINGSVYSDWLTFSDKFKIEDENIISELADENNTAIPAHFRKFRNPQIDLIVPLNKVENPINIFAYLPLSATKYQLDYIVNGDFIPNLDRSNFNESLSYNLKMADFAGQQILKACESFSSTSEFEKIKQLFPGFEAGNNRYKENVQISFLERVKDSKIFPSYYNGELNSFDKTLVDNTELYLILPQNQYIELTNTTGNPLNPTSELQSEYFFLYDKFDNGKIFKKEDLLLCLKNEPFRKWLKKPENCFSIITHFDSRSELQALLKTENLFLNSNNELVNSNLLYKVIPDEISFIGINVLNSELLELLKGRELSFKLMDFESVDFFKKYILGKEQETNSLLLNEDNLIAFWKFIYKYWESLEKEPTVINSLKNIHILCKSRNNRALIYKPISSTYLSLEFNIANEIESVINNIGITDVDFISEKYIDGNFKVEHWRRIFKKSEAITDLQAVMGVLISKLSAIDEQKHFEIGKQIFKYWKDNKDKETQLSINQITAVRNNLKIKCYDGSFLKASDSIIGDYYTTNAIIEVLLPEIKLNNQISVDYEKRTSTILDWNSFFKLIGCQPLSEKQNVFDAKIKHLLKNQELFRENHFEILQNLSQQYKERNNNNFSFEQLSELNLKTNNGEWILPSQIHLSSVYKPELDLQADENINNSYKFLDKNYYPNEIDKYFLINIGVNDGFYFEKIIPNIHIDKIKERDFANQLETIEKYRKRLQEIRNMTYKDLKGFIIRSYSNEKIRSVTYVGNHLQINYPQLLTAPKYCESFLNFVIKNKKLEILSTESELKIWSNNIYRHQNYIVWLIQEHPVLLNQEDNYLKPTELFTYSLINYIDSKSELPKTDYSSKIAENGKSLEEILGIKQKLSQKHCIMLLSRKENRIRHEQIEELQIIKILSDYLPSEEEKKNLFLMNKNCEWRPLNELSFSFDEQFEIEPSQHLHEDFVPIAKNFGIQELSENNFTLITEPSLPTCKDEIITFFENNATFIAFKIDETNYQEIKSDVIEKISKYEFYEVTEITKVFSETNPIFKKAIDFYIDSDNKIFYKDYWRSNKELIDYLVKDLFENKVKRNWLINLLNRWSEKEIIEDLKANSNGTLPPEIVHEDPSNPKDRFWNELTDEDETFIRDIIKGEYELNEQLDANTTAKIKTLMTIKDNYNYSEISDEGRYLKAGSDEIIVRSAQKGLLYLDLYHWGRLNDYNVKISVYTNNQVTIFNSQEDLFQFCQPQNKFGVLRMPDDYTLDDYNSLDNITEKGKWHFVFIVNENAKAAKQYKEIIDLDEYNNYG